jgi:hypothetical protein
MPSFLFGTNFEHEDGEMYAVILVESFIIVKIFVLSNLSCVLQLVLLNKFLIASYGSDFSPKYCRLINLVPPKLLVSVWDGYFFPFGARS